VIFGLLGRLLTPEDYGVFAFANAILVYVAHLSQRGLSSSLVRKPSLTPADYGSAYVMCAIVALFSSAVLIALWWIIDVSLPNQHEQSILLLFMAVPLAMQILATPAQVYLQRRVNFLAINAIQVASICLGNGVVGVVCALLGLGPWSLALAGAAAALVSLLLSLIVGRHSLHGSCTWPIVRAGLHDAMHFNAIRSLDVAWLQAPTIILGIIGAPAAVGIYQRMQFLADLGMQLTVWRITSVLYAALARRSDGLSIDKSQYRNVFTLCVLLVLPIIAFVLFATENIVSVLLGSQWTSGVTTLRLLIVAFGLTTINQAAAMALEHAGKVRQRVLQALTAVCIIVVLIFALSGLGPEYYAVPSLVSMVTSTILIHMAVGERWSDLPGLLVNIIPGLALFVAVAMGAVIAPVALEGLHMAPGSLNVLTLQFALSILFCSLCIPFLFRTRGLAPFVSAFATTFPKAFAKTRPLHWTKTP
jgi:PST family polysaccharide transporter